MTPPHDERLDDDALNWAEEEAAPASGHADSWHVLVVDDDDDVHVVTGLVLEGLVFNGRAVRLLHAKSGAAAVALLRERADVALVLLDVVMESDDAGLRTVRAIREELGNRSVRIVLRTGQPGRAPERDVVVRYEIDGYEVKTSLTAQSLVTVAVAALRAFDLITTLERSRRGLERIVDAAADVARTRTLQGFARAVLPQVQALVGVEGSALFCAPPRARDGAEQAVVLAGSGTYASLEGQEIASVDPTGALLGALTETVTRGSGVHTDEATTLRFLSPRKRAAFARIDARVALDPMDRQLLEVLCSKVAVLLDNVHLLEQLSAAQRATVVALADLAEHRDTDTGGHVLRVARTTDLIARDLHARGILGDALDEVLVEQIGLASMLHDVGKVAIPDAVLLKPGKLDADERTLMETHAEVGARILMRADDLVGDTSYMTVAAQIAQNHHEWFDGKGYPNGLAGEAIPLVARIAAVADVYDALTHARPYKPAWPESDAVGYIHSRSGTQFDPRVVDAFERVRSTPAFTRAASLPRDPSLPVPDGE